LLQIASCALASNAATARPTRASAGPARGPEPADRDGERGAGEQVNDIVLAQVHQREAEHAGVGEADRARRGADLRQQQRGHQ
jgi:hypothetical protein